jgi:predicted transposase YbfD/YdcC
MNDPICTPIVTAFSTVKDPRRTGRTFGHPLQNLISIAICAIIGGANDWVGICLFAENRKDWFAKFLDMKNGVPSHDTFCRVFAQINPEEFEASFQDWVNSICVGLKINHIAIDGKALRGSKNSTQGIECIKLVSAFATNINLTLAQTDVDEGSNEITAIPKLLKMLEISGAIVTIDAIGCQTEIVEQIIEQKGNYIIAVKENQPNLHEAIDEKFKKMDDMENNQQEWEHHSTTETNRGREETRHCYKTEANFEDDIKKKWKNVKSVIVIVSEREVNGKKSTEVRYYISSCDKSAEAFSKLIRDHWKIENKCHWTLDVTFQEDKSRVRRRNGARNFGLLRRLVLSLLKQKQQKKQSINAIRVTACMNTEYMESILQ